MTNDVANRLISELRLRNDRELSNFITEKNLSFQDTTEILVGLLQNYYPEYIFSIYRWLQKNLRTLIEKYSDKLVPIMEVISKKDQTYIIGLLSDLPELNLDIGYLKDVYAIANNSQDRQIRVSSGFFLGEIGTVKPEIILEEINSSLNASDESKKIACLKALLIASNKHRDTRFMFTDDTIRFIVDCTKSSNTGLSSEAIYDSVILFDRDPRFKTTLQEYFDHSPQNRMQVYQCIQYIDLNDMQFELSLLDKCANSQIHKEILLAEWVIGTKLFRANLPRNKYLDKALIQKFALEFIRKLFKREDADLSFLDGQLLSQIGNTDVTFAYEYVFTWICNEETNMKVSQFFYPKIIYYIFQNHENELVSFLDKLSHKSSDYDPIVSYTIEEMIFDLRLRIHSELENYNMVINRLKDLVENLNPDNMIAKEIDDIPSKVSEFLNILNKTEGFLLNSKRSTKEDIKRELENKKNFYLHKHSLLVRCLDLLIGISLKNNINYKKLTQNFNSKTQGLIIKCEILTNQLIGTRSDDNIDYNAIRINFEYFNNIKTYLGQDWLYQKYNDGYPYHWILVWLSRIISSEEMQQLKSEFANESDEIQKNFKSQRIEMALKSLFWLQHTDKCLSYFKENEKGSREIIEGLKDEGNFFKFLSHLEIALKLKHSGHEVNLECKSIDPQRSIDILATKDGLTLIFELATFDMYSHLKYLNRVSHIPDRARSKLIEKLTDQIKDYANKTANPIILVFNLTHAPDLDMHGVLYCLHGVNVEHIPMGEGSERYVTFERDREFIRLPEASTLSALIYYNNIVNENRIETTGDLVLNKSASRKLDENTVTQLKRAIFGNNIRD